MVRQESRDVERKEFAILKILKGSPVPVGSRVIAHRLRDYGIDLNERAVRYHLETMDKRGLTNLVSHRRGRLVTRSGIDELDSARVRDRIGSAMTNTEMLICQASFDLDKLAGEVPINVSFFPAERFSRSLEVMRALGKSSVCASDLVFMAGEGEKLGGFEVPEGKVGFATLSNVTISTALLKAGVPLTLRYAGVLQVRNYHCHRFVDVIEYTGSTLNPFEVFIACKMTSISGIPGDGNGKILASFCELPAFALPRVEAVIQRLEATGIRIAARLGRIGEPVCEIPVGAGKFGVILTDGLNLAVAAVEAGIEVENHACCSVFEFTRLRDINDFCTSLLKAKH